MFATLSDICSSTDKTHNDVVQMYLINKKCYC